MKRILAMLILLSLLLPTAAGCAKKPPAETGGDTTEPTLIDPPKTQPPDTASPVTDPVVTDSPVTEPVKTEAKPLPDGFVGKVNDDVFWGVGKTYAEVEAKFGKGERPSLTSLYLRFKNDFGNYLWQTPFEMKRLDIDPFITGCREISGIKPETIFTNAELPLLISDLEDHFGMKYIAEYTVQNNGEDRYYAQLGYGGATLVIVSDEKGVITSDSACTIEKNKYYDSPKTVRVESHNLYRELLSECKTAGELHELLSGWSSVAKFRFYNENGELKYEEYKEMPLDKSISCDATIYLDNSVYVSDIYHEYVFSYQNGKWTTGSANYNLSDGFVGQVEDSYFTAGNYPAEGISADKLFLGAEFPIYASDMKEHFGVAEIADYIQFTYPDNDARDPDFYFQFGYKGAAIIVVSDESGRITADSVCYIKENKYPDSPVADGMHSIHDIYKNVISSCTVGRDLHDLVFSWSSVKDLKVFKDNIELTYDEYWNLLFVLKTTYERNVGFKVTYSVEEEGREKQYMVILQDGKLFTASAGK